MVPSQKYPFVNMGVSGISYFSPYKNLFFIGPYNLPGLGAEGEYAISYEIANRLVEYSKGKQLFRSPFSRARSVSYQLASYFSHHRGHSRRHRQLLGRSQAWERHSP